MRLRVGFSFIIFLLAASVLFNGCAASYPKEKIIERSVDLIKKETGKVAKIFFKGQTLYTVIHLSNLIDDKLQLSDRTLDIIQQTMLVVNRVTLSTDADILFFVVVVIDETTGVEIQFTQYIEDIRRWILSNISRNDFYSRSLTDIYTNKQDYVFSEDDFKEITLPDFIIRQTISRLKKEEEISNNIILQLLLSMDILTGEFKKEDRIYYFEYLIKEDDDKDEDYSEYISPEFVTLLRTIHEDVCKKYRFVKAQGLVIKEGARILYSNI